MKHALLFLCALSIVPGLPAADRVALVIGNNKYTNLPDTRQLTSPVSDATDIASALQGLGYVIVTGKAITDATRDEILTAAEAFAQTARSAESAVFYYSGHGVQVGEDNYLLASDTPKLTGVSVLKGRAVLLRDTVMVALEEAGAKNKAIILDCCRDNPFAAQLELALASVGKNVKTKSVGEITGYGPGFYLAFATSPGLTANDGNGQRNSPFTAALLKSLPGGAGKDIDSLFRDVKVLLGDEQVSWTSHSLRTSFTLARATESKEDRMKVMAPGMSEAEVQRRIAEAVAAAEARARTNLMPPAAPRPSSPQTISPSAIVAPAPISMSVAKVGAKMDVGLPGAQKMTFCYCPAGSFTMGSSDPRETAIVIRKQERVNLTQGFWMAVTECTQGQWQAVMNDNPSTFKGDDNLPVETVSWEQADAFISRLNATVTLPAGLKFSLPTEAQWEYACRAGTAEEFSFGSSLSATQANFNGGSPARAASMAASRGRTVRVGSYPANAWGLRDMHGNVWEWCRDTWDGMKGLRGGDDPMGDIGPRRVNRGGSWASESYFTRSSHRNSAESGYSGNSLGFRAALIPVDK